MTATGAVVVGGGLTGLAAAVVLARSGVETTHLAPSAPLDRRTSALMQPSIDFLAAAGLVGDPSEIGHALSEIRIIDATRRLIRAPETVFRAAEANLAAFGWNMPNVALSASFEAARDALPNLRTIAQPLAGLDASGNRWTLTLADGHALTAGLVVGADGKKSFVRSAAGFKVRERAFAQSALVCDLELSRPLGGASIEFHYEQGPFTLVPAGEARANLVWIDNGEVLRAAQAGGAELLREIFLEKSQRLLGNIRLLTPSFIFPLSTLSVDRAARDGVVLVGEAAHAFPPIGAQGLNLGLRDVADLSSALSNVNAQTEGWASSLSADYADRRNADLGRTGGMVDALFRSLLSDFVPAQAVRAAGLWAMKLSPKLRREAFSLGMGVR